MSITAASTWEVRSTGSDTQGGVFDPSFGGTDFSQQDAAQLSLTDVVTNGTTTVTSATGGFVAAHKGNGINIAGTVYQIMAVGSSTSITVDRATGTGSGQTGKVGGAVASLGFVGGQATLQNVVYQKSGSYTITSSSVNVSGGIVQIGMGLGGSRVVKLRFEGYGATRGDLGTKPVNTLAAGISGPIIDSLDQYSAPAIINNIAFDGGSVAGSIGVRNSGNPAGDIQVQRCKFSHFTSVALKLSGSGNSCDEAYLNEFTLNSGTSILTGAPGQYVVGNSLHDNTATPINGGSAIVRGNLIYNNTGASTDGVQPQDGGRMHVIGNTIYGNGRHGVNIGNNASPNSHLVENNIIVANAGWGVTTTTGADPELIVRANATYGNTSGGISTNLTSPLNEGNVPLSTNPFVNAATGNFALNNTAGGGAACRAAGIPGAFPGGTTTGYPDIGAVQHQAGGGGSGGASPWEGAL